MIPHPHLLDRCYNLQPRRKLGTQHCDAIFLSAGRLVQPLVFAFAISTILPKSAVPGWLELVQFPKVVRSLVGGHTTHFPIVLHSYGVA